MTSKKSDLKSELTDLLLNDESKDKDLSEPVTIGSPDQTEILKKKREKALAAKRIVATEDSNPFEKSREEKIDSNLSTIAKDRIEQLESESDELRAENEKLNANLAALKTQRDEMTKRIVEWEKRYKDLQEKKDFELDLLREDLGHKSTQLTEAQSQLEELESRFEGEFHKIRVKERELQNRLDIMKHEGNAVLRHKDELILSLKRQIEQANYEMESFRKKNQSIHSDVEAQQERMKRAVKALRVAVSLLDGEEEKVPIRKAE